MAEPQRRHRYTYAEYVALERVSSEKQEFVDGEIYTIVGESRDHSRIQAKIVHLLVGIVGDGPCECHGSDLRIYVEAFRLATFPDAAVICGDLQQHEPSPRATALNPNILVEITSDSSESLDHGLKREAYHTIPALREYVVVSHKERRVTIDVRNSDGTWSTRTATRGEKFELPSLSAWIDVDDVYRKSTIA